MGTDSLEVDLRAIIELADAGEIEIAKHSAAGLLREYPNHPAAISTMAYVMYCQEEHGIGYSLMRRVVEMLPANDVHQNTMGMMALGCMDYNEAERFLKSALKINPRNSIAMSNLALTYVNKCEPGMALEWANKALTIAPTDTNILEIKGYAQLMMGMWEEGFGNYEYVVNGKVRRVKPLGLPYWKGEPRKTLVIQGEQGLGDEISFASVIPDLKGIENVIFDCHERLAGLFQRSFPHVEVHGTRNETVRPDWLEGTEDAAQCLVGSLASHYRKTDADFPGTPYLVADPERRIQWRALLDSLGPRPKVGIAWKGGRPHTRRKYRSITLEQLLPILRQDATFISLEYKSPGLEIEAFEERHGIKVHHWDWAVQAHDYDATAALVAELDVVVSVQTSAVHLSGALGKPCYVLLPRQPLWRYGVKGGDFIWAKSVKLFRQDPDWAGPINRVAETLRARHL